MYGIEILVKEHENILRLTKIIRKMLIKSLNEDKKICVEDFKIVVEIIKNYTDAHHHGKEEEILFKYMLEEIGPVAQKIIRNGMLVEHDQARHSARNLSNSLKNYENENSTENFLDLLGFSFKYLTLLEDHAARENTVVYPFAEKTLKKETKLKIDEESRSE